MANYKVLKLVLKGEVIERLEAFKMPDGTDLYLDKVKKIITPSKKNNQNIIISKKERPDGGMDIKPVLIPSDKHRQWEVDHLPIFEAWRDKCILAGLSMPLTRAKMKILFYFPDARNYDLSNKCETIQDMLRKSGMIMDDKFKVLKPIELDGWVRRDKPRTEIFLTVLSPENKEYEWDQTPPTWSDVLKARKTARQKVRRHLAKMSSDTPSDL